jgi:hypothetical protein
MKNSVLIFILGGVFLVAAIVIGYIYIPRLDQVNGTRSISDLTLELPVRRLDLRYVDGGIIPFCKDKNTKGISFEVKPEAEIYSATDGTVTVVDGGMVEVQPKDGVAIQYATLEDIVVSVGDYVQSQDPLGQVEEKRLLFSLLNSSDSIYECPYGYFNGDAQSLVDINFENSEYSGLNICGCSVLKK